MSRKKPHSKDIDYYDVIELLQGLDMKNVTNGINVKWKDPE